MIQGIQKGIFQKELEKTQVLKICIINNNTLYQIGQFSTAPYSNGHNGVMEKVVVPQDLTNGSFTCSFTGTSFQGHNFF